MPETRHHIWGAIVVARPDARDSVVERLSSMPGVEVHGSGAGKIVVVLEGPTADHLGAMLIRISAMDDVVSANMVFEQAIKEEEVSDDDRTHAA